MNRETIFCFLKGEHTHIDVEWVLVDCDPAITDKRVGGIAHTIYQILNHMIFWQDVYLDRMEGTETLSPVLPSAGWPGEDAPADVDAWLEAVQVFQQGLAVARELANGDLSLKIPTFRNASLGECLVYLSLHNSHHIGQIIMLRQALGDWPAISDAW